MIIVQATGQTCNQFWIYSNFIANCIEKNEKLVIWVPDVSIRDFDNLHNSEYVCFCLYFKFLVKLFGYKRYFKLTNLIFNNKYSLKLTQFLCNLVPGIQFEIADVTMEKSQYRLKHLDKLKEIFQPNKNITSKAIHLFDQHRKANTLIIGIHLRRGDYRNFLGGKFYYSFEQYNSFLQKLTKLFGQQNVVFFLASDENIDISKFYGFNCFKFDNGSVTLDIVGLSMCDYICGPPSTFSGWASFYHDKPIYFIENIDDQIAIECFFQIKDRFQVE